MLVVVALVVVGLGIFLGARQALGEAAALALRGHAAPVTAVAFAPDGKALASGDSALRNIGIRAARVDEIEEYIVAVQRATAGETAVWQGAEFGLHWLPEPAPVPVWIAV